jgi:hypothetical protein
MKQGRNFRKSLQLLTLGMAGFFTITITGCFVAIPAAVWYFKKDNHYVAEAQIPLSVDQVYKNALQRAEEGKDKNLQILKKDDAKRMIEITDGVQKAVFEAKELDARNSIITVTADVPEKKDVKDAKEEMIKAEKELALRIISTVCEASKVECTIVKKDEEKK